MFEYSVKKWGGREKWINDSGEEVLRSKNLGEAIRCFKNLVEDKGETAYRICIRVNDECIIAIATKDYYPHIAFHVNDYSVLFQSIKGKPIIEDKMFCAYMFPQWFENANLNNSDEAVDYRRVRATCERFIDGVFVKNPRFVENWSFEYKYDCEEKIRLKRKRSALGTYATWDSRVDMVSIWSNRKIVAEFKMEDMVMWNIVEQEELALELKEAARRGEFKLPETIEWHGPVEICNYDESPMELK